MELFWELIDLIRKWGDMHYEGNDTGQNVPDIDTGQSTIPVQTI